MLMTVQRGSSPPYLYVLFVLCVSLYFVYMYILYILSCYGVVQVVVCMVCGITVLNISKLKNEPQPFYNVLLYLRTLCIVLSPVRRRVTRRLTGLKTMYNALKYRKAW